MAKRLTLIDRAVQSIESDRKILKEKFDKDDGVLVLSIKKLDAQRTKKKPKAAKLAPTPLLPETV